jgi:hypothetical protein
MHPLAGFDIFMNCTSILFHFAATPHYRLLTDILYTIFFDFTREKYGNSEFFHLFFARLLFPIDKSSLCNTIKIKEL